MPLRTNAPLQVVRLITVSSFFSRIRLRSFFLRLVSRLFCRCGRRHCPRHWPTDSSIWGRQASTISLPPTPRHHRCRRPFLRNPLRLPPSILHAAAVNLRASPLPSIPAVLCPSPPKSQLLPIAPTPPPIAPKAADIIIQVAAAILCTPPVTPCFSGNNQPG